MKNKIIRQKVNFVLLFGFIIFQTLIVKIVAQSVPETIASPESAEDYTWWYLLAVLIIGLGAALLWRMRNKQAEKMSAGNPTSAHHKNNRKTDSFDAGKEMQRLGKNQTISENSYKQKKAQRGSFENKQTENEFQEIKADAPPVFGFHGLTLSRPFLPLSASNDESLLSAIEQTKDEDEEDEKVRDSTLEILKTFKNRNSVEALAQVALYDLSSSLRSKAVSTLADFDHESVFEAILMACADPTREVRAAAARGLSRLSFDRADAWSRIAETGEEGRMRHAARAATEGGFVEQSFERLVHPDRRMAYQSFALLALLIKAGEVEPIFEALKNHPDKNIKLAILHLIKVTRNPNTLDGLNALLEDEKLLPEITQQVGKTIEKVGFVAA